MNVAKYFVISLFIIFTSSVNAGSEKVLKRSSVMYSNCNTDYLSSVVLSMMSLISETDKLSQLKEKGVYDDIQYFYPKVGPSLDATLFKNKKIVSTISRLSEHGSWVSSMINASCYEKNNIPLVDSIPGKIGASFNRVKLNKIESITNLPEKKMKLNKHTHEYIYEYKKDQLTIEFYVKSENYSPEDKFPSRFYSVVVRRGI